MRDEKGKRVARRLFETWQRTGVFPTLRWPEGPGFWTWFKRNTGFDMAKQAVETLGDRLKSMLGVTHAHVLVSVEASLRHRSGCMIEGTFAYGSGLLPLERAREFADTLRAEGYGVTITPRVPGLFDSLLRAHDERRRRHDNDPEPEVLTPTASLGERMRLFGLAPQTLSLAQLRGEEPLPSGVRLARLRTPAPAPEPAFAPAFRPAYG